MLKEKSGDRKIAFQLFQSGTIYVQNRNPKPFWSEQKILVFLQDTNHKGATGGYSEAFSWTKGEIKKDRIQADILGDTKQKKFFLKNGRNIKGIGMKFLWVSILQLLCQIP